MQVGCSGTGAGTAGRCLTTALALAGAWLCLGPPVAAGVNRWASVEPAGGFFDLAAAPSAPGTLYARLPLARINHGNTSKGLPLVV